MTADVSVVAAVGVSRDYVLPAHTINALVDVNLIIEPGSMVAVRGRSRRLFSICWVGSIARLRARFSSTDRTSRT